jgi:hypothetical protein
MSQENENTPSIIHSHSNDSTDSSSCDSYARADLYREIIRPPVAGDKLAYEVKFDKPQFNVVNGYLSIVPRSYEYNLCNAVSLLQGDTIEIKVTVPKQILGCKHGYEFPNPLVLNNLIASLKLEADNANLSVLLNGTGTPPGIVVQDNIGWITFTITYVLPQALDNLCSLSYSIDFDSIKLVTLYSSCKKANCSSCKKNKRCRRPFESITLESETTLSFTAMIVVP